MTSPLEAIWHGRHRDKRREHVAGRFTSVCERCACSTEECMPGFNSALYPEVLRS